MEVWKPRKLYLRMTSVKVRLEVDLWIGLAESEGVDQVIGDMDYDFRASEFGKSGISAMRVHNWRPADAAV